MEKIEEFVRLSREPVKIIDPTLECKLIYKNYEKEIVSKTFNVKCAKYVLLGSILIVLGLFTPLGMHLVFNNFLTTLVALYPSYYLFMLGVLVVKWEPFYNRKFIYKYL